MPDSDTGERVTTVLDLPSRDGLVVNAVRVDYEPGALHAVSRDASDELRASLLAFFVLGEGESPTVYDGDA